MKPTEVDTSGASDKDGKDAQDTRSKFDRLLQQEKQSEETNSINSFITVSTHVSNAGPSFDNVVPSPPINTAGPSSSTGLFGNAYDDEMSKKKLT
ncbi:hypothetical protein Tco_0326389 [Tanacetum coccineum]